MTLVESWNRLAFDVQNQPVKHVWDEYLAKENLIYVDILKNKTTKIEGKAKDLAERFNLTLPQMGAFFDGIHECIDNLGPIEAITEDTDIAFDIQFDRLYKQMVEYKAEALYNLPEWDDIFSKEEQKRLFNEQKRSHTIVRNDNKVGRNDPCPCGSGKKYKKCCA